MIDIFFAVNICISNNSSVTYAYPASGSTAALDLSICDPS